MENGDYELIHFMCDEMIDYSILGIDPVNAKSGFASGSATYGTPEGACSYDPTFATHGHMHACLTVIWVKNVGFQN